MNQLKHAHRKGTSKKPHSVAHEAPKAPSKRLSRIEPDHTLEATDLAEIGSDDPTAGLKDPNFQSELEYEGYLGIEEYDNDAYQSDPDGKLNPKRELNFKDREEMNNGEENLLDPQEGKK